MYFHLTIIKLIDVDGLRIERCGWIYRPGRRVVVKRGVATCDTDG